MCSLFDQCSERSSLDVRLSAESSSSSYSSDVFPTSFGTHSGGPVLAAGPMSTSLMLSAASEAVQHKSAVHSTSSASPTTRLLLLAEGCADGILEVVEMGAR